jgi:hypothetical protein
VSWWCLARAALVFSTPAGVTAKKNLIPVTLPLFPPGEGTSAGGAGLGWQMLLFDTSHDEIPLV